MAERLRVVAFDLGLLGSAAFLPRTPEQGCTLQEVQEDYSQQ